MFAFDDGDFQAKLGGADGGDIAPRSGTDHDYVEALGSHLSLLQKK